MNFLQLEQAKHLLRYSDMQSPGICEQIGIKDRWTFQKEFLKGTGMSITQYRASLPQGHLLLSDLERAVKFFKDTDVDLHDIANHLDCEVSFLTTFIQNVEAYELSKKRLFSEKRSSLKSDRIELAKGYLTYRCLSLDSCATLSGYVSYLDLDQNFQHEVGIKPTEWRAKAWNLKDTSSTKIPAPRRYKNLHKFEEKEFVSACSGIKNYFIKCGHKIRRIKSVPEYVIEARNFLDNTPTPSHEIPSKLGIDRAHLNETFKFHFGYTMYTYRRKFNSLPALPKPMPAYLPAAEKLVVETDLPIRKIASMFKKNPGRFVTTFKAHYGRTPDNHRSHKRGLQGNETPDYLIAGTKLLETTTDSIKEIALKVGVHFRTFADNFKIYYGTTPAAHRVANGFEKTKRVKKQKVLSDPDQQQVKVEPAVIKALNFLSTTGLPMPEIAHQVDWSLRGLFKKIKAHTGMTPEEYRLKNGQKNNNEKDRQEDRTALGAKFKTLIHDASSIEQAIEESGYGRRGFYRAFKRSTGQTPCAYFNIVKEGRKHDGKAAMVHDDLSQEPDCPPAQECAIK